MFEQSLIQIGLSYYQATVYETLLQHGPLRAGKVSRLTPLKRGLVYKVLDELVEMQIVEKNEPLGKVAVFQAGHPTKLRTFAEEKEQRARDAKLALDGILPSIVSQFALISGKPGVQYFEGVEGLAEAHRDIVVTGQPVCLIRSVYDNEHPEVERIVAEHIQERVRRGIPVRAITPSLEHFTARIFELDKTRLFERRLVPKEKLTLPAQISIYGKKVTITNFKDGIITTIIDNAGIAETFRIIFEYLWESGETVHSQLEKEVRRRPAE